MDNFLSTTLLQWIAIVDAPLITAFIITFTRLRGDVNRQIEKLREKLNACKLDMAQNYASVNQVKDLEARLIAHLLRIETKLDNTALKAHAVYVGPNNHPGHKEI